LIIASRHDSRLVLAGHSPNRSSWLLDARYGEADILTHLGDTHQITGNPQAAREAWQQALSILEELEHPEAEQVRNKLAVLDMPTADLDIRDNA
jgi:hypothetical protein